MSNLKDFATVRELEKKTARIFTYGGSGLLAGLVLMFIFLPMGVIVTVASAALILGGIAWISMLGKEPSRQMFCPYCSSRNDVYQSRESFNCDICNRPVIISDTGEPMMAQPMDR